MEIKPKKEIKAKDAYLITLYFILIQFLTTGFLMYFFPFNAIIMISNIIMILFFKRYINKRNINFRKLLHFDFNIKFIISFVFLVILLNHIAGFIPIIILKLFPSAAASYNNAVASANKIFIFKTLSGFIITFISLCIVAPFTEELIFRGFVQSVLVEKSGLLKGLVIASLLFAVIHFNLWVFPGVFIAGLLLGYFFIRTQSLWSVAVIHAANNMLVMIFSNVKLPALSLKISLAAIAASVILIFYIWKKFGLNLKPLKGEYKKIISDSL